MQLQELVRLSLIEDVGSGDITSNATIPMSLKGTAVIRAKEQMVVCGHEVAKEVFKQRNCSYSATVEEGLLIDSGTVIAEITGSVRDLLTAERLALNFLMRLSGISSHTFSTVQGINEKLTIVDTRKTTPLLRALERRAVVVGGGANHRFALYDGILIKDNHIVGSGSITKAIHNAKRVAHHLLKIEIEVENIEQLKEAIDAGADVVMLDNMTDETLQQAVAIANGRVLLEASGNMNRTRIIQIQDFGIDVVSMGGLIHQATWADLSMKMKID